MDKELEKALDHLSKAQEILGKFISKGFSNFERDIKIRLNSLLKEYATNKDEKSYIKKTYPLLMREIKSMKSAYKDDVKDLDIIIESIDNLITALDYWYRYSEDILPKEVSRL